MNTSRAACATLAVFLGAFSLATTLAADAAAGGIASKQIEMMFERFDRDRNGTISLQEFDGIQEIRFFTADMDDDGVITRDELVFTRGMRGVPREHTVADFSQLDRDRNGRVTIAEFAATKSAAFQSLDLDRDGGITPGEVTMFAARSDRGL